MIAGVGVDDTRMDLSHFEEGGGRSVPSTPLQISPTESRDTSLFQGEPSVVEETPEETPEEEAASQEEEEEEEEPGPLAVSSPPTVLVTEAPESTEGPSSAIVVSPIVEEPAEPEESSAKAEPAVIHSSPPTIVISPVPVLEVTPEEREELLLSEGEAPDTGADAGSEAQASEEPAPSGAEQDEIRPCELPAVRAGTTDALAVLTALRRPWSRTNRKPAAGRRPPLQRSRHLGRSTESHLRAPTTIPPRKPEQCS
ncbi:hypothetical protein HPB49_021031 [Dermacentor silvarum]|uniref:Uncharacterized protein n=1 Tax=Dermacentor silvarum TaxID=543639 RepID=A0ACB8DFY7_DERSI|nr:hypothetical protein HPB49_021031 [Dermacentor silvarum]